jgi:Flp pilus assembly protein TadG
MIRNRREQESGQILVILALAMIGLLVAAGLAVDGGVLMMRKAQLDRAVDSAALAGVTELAEQGEVGAHDRDDHPARQPGPKRRALPRRELGLLRL